MSKSKAGFGSGSGYLPSQNLGALEAKKKPWKLTVEPSEAYNGASGCRFASL